MEVQLSAQPELKTERFQIMLEKSAIDEIDDWSFRNRVRSRAEAMRLLVRLGLSATQNEKGDASA